MDAEVLVRRYIINAGVCNNICMEEINRRLENLLFYVVEHVLIVRNKAIFAFKMTHLQLQASASNECDRFPSFYYFHNGCLAVSISTRDECYQWKLPLSGQIRVGCQKELGITEFWIEAHFIQKSHNIFPDSVVRWSTETGSYLGR